MGGTGLDVKSGLEVLWLGSFHHPAVSSQPLARLNPQRAIRFERRGTKEKPVFWVVLLYRDALRMIQGAVEHSSRHGKSWFPGVGEATLLPWQATRSAPPAWQARGEMVTAA